MVFHARLQAFLNNLRQGKYFGLEHPVTYLTMSIEYQNRGMPHAHIVIQLGNMPKYSETESIIDWIDTHISAEMSNDRHSEMMNLIRFKSTFSSSKKQKTK